MSERLKQNPRVHSGSINAVKYLRLPGRTRQIAVELLGTYDVLRAARVRLPVSGEVMIVRQAELADEREPREPTSRKKRLEAERKERCERILEAFKALGKNPVPLAELAGKARLPAGAIWWIHKQSPELNGFRMHQTTNGIEVYEA